MNPPDIVLLLLAEFYLENRTTWIDFIGKYLALASKEDIYITKNGKSIAKLTNTNQDKVEMAKSLFGILPTDSSLEQAREERLNRHENSD